MKPRRATLLCFTMVLFLAPFASANTFVGKVIKITDGDTLYVLDADYQEHKIRLAGIDAPTNSLIISGDPVAFKTPNR